MDVSSSVRAHRIMAFWSTCKVLFILAATAAASNAGECQISVFCHLISCSFLAYVQEIFSKINVLTPFEAFHRIFEGARSHEANGLARCDGRMFRSATVQLKLRKQPFKWIPK